MKREFTVNSALSWLVKNSHCSETTWGILVKRGSLNGLKACSAFDYLKNHAGKKIMLVDNL